MEQSFENLCKEHFGVDAEKVSKLLKYLYKDLSISDYEFLTHTEQQILSETEFKSLKEKSIKK